MIHAEDLQRNQLPCVAKVKEFIDEIYILKHIIRYNTVPKISNESVAEHTFFVSAIVLQLHKYYSFNLEKALVMSIVHDYCETHISDVPRNVKNKYARLREVLAEVESGVWKDIYPEYAPFVEELEERKTVESKIVNIADLLSVAQYSNAEVKLGNEGYMKKVFLESSELIDKRFKEIEEYQTNEH